MITQNEYNMGLIRGKNADLLILRNGVDLDIFSPDEEFGKKKKEKLRAKYGIPGHCKLVGFVAANIGPWMDLDCMLEASILFPEDVHLVVIGGGRNIRSVEGKRYPGVTFTGNVSNRDVKSLLEIFDICIYAISERFARPFYGSPRKLMEWVAMGIPIVMTDITPKPPFLEEGQNVIYCRVNDPVDMAEKVKSLAENGSLLERMKEHDLGVRDSVSWDRFINESGLTKRF